MSRDRHSEQRRGSAFRAGPPPRNTSLRDNLESIAIALLIVLFLRQTCVEAFRIRHGSMAPTLAGVHFEARCPNCGYVLGIGDDKAPTGEFECPNCRYRWRRPRGGTGPMTGAEVANRIPRGAARVFVNKFVYQVRRPRRWEVIVFRVGTVRCNACGWEGRLASDGPAVCPVSGCGSNDFEPVEVRCDHCRWAGKVPEEEPDRCPYCGRTKLQRVVSPNFIKRVVGLRGERIALFDGDIHADGAIVRKPPNVQGQFWMHVYDSLFVPEATQEDIWVVESGAGRWDVPRDGGALSVNATGLTEPAMVAYGPAVTDYYAYDGLAHLGRSGGNPVGDCRLRVRVLAEEGSEGGEVILEVEDAGRRFTCAVPVGGAGETVLRQDGEPVERTAFVLEPGEATWLALENYDDRIVVRAAGRLLLACDYEPAPGYRQSDPVARKRQYRRAVRFGARGSDLSWQRVRIERDIYYVSHLENAGLRRGPYKAGEDGYIVLGDNSPASSDSRSAGWVRPGVGDSHLVGRAFFVFWPVHMMKWLASGGTEPAESDM